MALVVPNPGLMVPANVAHAEEVRRSRHAPLVAAIGPKPDTVCDDEDTFDLPDRKDEHAIWIARKDAPEIPDCMWESIPIPLFRNVLVLERRLSAAIGAGHLVLDEISLRDRQGRVTQGRVIAVNKWAWCAKSFIVLDQEGNECLPGRQVRPGDWISYDPLASAAKELFHPRTRQSLRFRVLSDMSINCGVSPETDPLW